MLQRILSVDLGNSRCKLRWWNAARDGSPPLATLDLPSRDASLAPLHAWLTLLDAAPEHVCVVVSSVAGTSRTQDVVCTLDARFPGCVLAPPNAGLIVECRPIEGVGSDRLFAARGAWERARRPCLIVDAGTALTVDAVDALSAHGRVTGRFLGGAIAPGPELVADALHAGTARLPRVSLITDPAPIGRSTDAALQSGIVLGFRGAARELVARIASAAGLDTAPVVLTGGARGFLLAPSVFGDRGVIEDAELVHVGLLAAARAHAGIP
ncbi:MAG: type III pantothenate kinase [Planctomycetota bacterium]